MNVRATIALMALAGASAGVSLAAAPAPPVAAPAAAPEEKDPASGVVLRGMMWRLAQTMKGRPVVAVGYGEFREDIPWSDAAFALAQTDLAKLQIIAAKNSPRDNELIPFKVGSAYVIAPQMREGLNPDLSRLSTLDATGRGLLLADFVTGLSPDQLTALGSDQGLAVSSLPAEARQLLARAFRPPLGIVTYKAETSQDVDGLSRQVSAQQSAGSLDAPVDWTQARIRARLRMQGVSMNSEGAYGFIDGGTRAGKAFVNDGSSHTPWQDRGVDLPLFPQMPNTFKPSDLTGKAFTQPLGLAGVWPVKEVAKRLSAATGLALTVWKPFQDEPVFLGSESIAAGDVLDALRLALTGSWRKMGDAYYLAWDRLPLLGIQQVALEGADAAMKSVKKERSAIARDTGWLDVANTLPFDPNDPFALTPGQRQTLFGPGDGKSVRSGATIPYGELTTEQQKAVRAGAANAQVYLFAPGQAGTPKERAFTDDDIRATKLNGTATVEISLQVPGEGWVAMLADMEGLSISSSQMAMIRALASPETAPDPLADAPPGISAMLDNPQPATLPSAVRGLVVPALGEARLNTLADEMKRHGLNVLFYPALYDGYATFAGTPFPLAPALRGADGLAAAVAAMKPNNIRVVAYLNTLAWQDEGDPVHWLNNHPDWLDLDVLGRGRLEWFRAHPDAASPIPGFTEAPHNYVRPSEPQVAARLSALVKALAARPDIAAVSFAGLTPSSMPDFMGTGLSAPPLGYSMVDRLAAFRQTGDDPADAVNYNDYVPDAVLALGGIRSGAAAHDTLADARAALLSRLLREAKTLRPDWRAYVLKDSIGEADLTSSAAAPAAKGEVKPDLVIGNVFSTNIASAGASGIMFPITRTNIFDSIPEEQADLMGKKTLDRLKAVSPMVLFQTFFVANASMKDRTVPMALYDFRAAPELITDSLKWVKAPEAAAGK
jgi:hypothetical protein